MTAMGSRKLKQWINYPLLDLDQIRERLERVEGSLEEPSLRQTLRATLKRMYDMERLVAKVCLKPGQSPGSGGPEEFPAAASGLSYFCLAKKPPRPNSWNWRPDWTPDRRWPKRFSGPFWMNRPRSSRDKEARMIRPGYHPTWTSI